MFVWVKLHPDLDAGILVERAIEHGVVFVPGQSFFAGTPEINTMRLTFATATNEQIDAGTKRLANALKEQQANAVESISRQRRP
jgi:2-aminoadipate transaminase